MSLPCRRRLVRSGGANMTHEPESARPKDEQSADYGYDMAHEAMTAGMTSARRTERHRAVHVSTETADREQDYGYDLAHDVPRVEGG
jgi:hypothetical protein